MAKRKKAVAQNAMPLLRRINAGKFTRAEVTDKLELGDVQNITNWLARGVPAKRLPDVAALCGLSTDEYRHEAGLLSQLPEIRVAHQINLLTGPLREDFEALPDYLQEFIAKRVNDLRRRYEQIPLWFREKLVPPKDPEHYRQWEREIEALVLKLGDGP